MQTENLVNSEDLYQHLLEYCELPTGMVELVIKLCPHSIAKIEYKYFDGREITNGSNALKYKE